MAKSQMRPSKEKKKPKADKTAKPKQLSAYKQAQLGSAPTMLAPSKKV
jgi:hypothetical protein